VTGYVACLECDEYWSAAHVQKLVAHLKSKTDKPVGVHLTSGLGGHKGNMAYYANADYVFLQTGWNKTPAQITAMVKQAMAVTGKPVVASEYANRSIVSCGYEAPPPKKNNDADTAMAVVGIVVLAVGAYYLHTNYDFELKFNATENWQSYGTGKSFALTDSLNFNTEFTHIVTNSFNDNIILFSISGSFD
jgi:hypothetical protein